MLAWRVCALVLVADLEAVCVCVCERERRPCVCCMRLSNTRIKERRARTLSFILTLNLSNLQDNKEERNGDMKQYRASPMTERKKTTSRLDETKNRVSSNW